MGVTSPPLRCATCHGDLSGAVAMCPACGTALHTECWGELSRCPTLGCRALPPGRVPPGLSSSDRRKLWVLVALSIAVCAFSPFRGHRWQLETRASDAHDLQFTRDGKRLVARCVEGLRVANVAEGTWELYPRNGYGGIAGLAVSPLGELIAAGEWLWATDSLSNHPGVRLARLPGPPVAYAPDGRAIACFVDTGKHRALRLVDERGERLRELDLGPESDDDGNLWWEEPMGSFSSSGALLAARTPGGVRVWNLATGDVRLELRDQGPISSLRLSDDGATLAVTSRGRFVHWSVDSGAEVASLKLREPSPLGYMGASAISPDLSTAAFSEGDDFLGSISWARMGSIWPRPHRWTGFYVHTMTFSPDGGLLAVAGIETNRVQLWSVD